jgi:ADP-L-glycero-D-manno-heptose 6-epimerase
MIVVTGAQGFIGKYLIGKTSEEVLEVEYSDSLEFLRSFRNWSEVSGVFHQGAISDTTYLDEKELKTYNTDFSIELISRATSFGVPIRYASSASVYGSPSDHGRALTPYAASKLAVDSWVNDNIDTFESLVQGFRYFNVYGPGEGSKVLRGQGSPVSTFIAQARKGGPIRVFEGSSEFRRDFVFVEDVVSVVLENREGSGVFDLGSTHAVSFLEVAELVANKFSVEIETIPFPKNLVHGYQTFTQSSKDWDREFTRVEEYVKDYRLD